MVEANDARRRWCAISVRLERINVTEGVKARRRKEDTRVTDADGDLFSLHSPTEARASDYLTKVVADDPMLARASSRGSPRGDYKFKLHYKYNERLSSRPDPCAPRPNFTVGRLFPS